MDIFSTQSYRISPLAKQAFSEKQKLRQASNTTTNPIGKSEKKTNSQESKNQFNVQRELQQLKSRNLEAHEPEATHIAVGGSLIRSAANFKYQRGSDGVNYAAGGDLSIDISKEDGPHKNPQKAVTIRHAALAPANPSATSHAVAAQASQMAAIAHVEIARMNLKLSNEQFIASEPSRNNGGAAQYQQLERETNPEKYQLSKYA